MLMCFFPWTQRTLKKLSLGAIWNCVLCQLAAPGSAPAGAAAAAAASAAALSAATADPGVAN
jgi:hypothetical protein